MAKPRKLQVAILNIVTHPHSEEGYASLLRAAVRNDILARYWGNKAGMFGSLNKYQPASSKVDGVFAGELHLFTDFDPESRWFNIAERAEASDDDVQKISLPKNLRPDHKSVPFVFFSKHHCMAYDTTDLAPSSARKLVELVLRSPQVAGEKTVSVTVEPAQGTVAALLGRSGLKQVSLTLRCPNPDDLATLEARIQERFKKMNTATKIEEYRASRGKNLKPDDELKEIAKVAGSNGEVAIKRIDADGHTHEESTREHPKQLFGIVDPDLTTDFDTIYQLGFEHLEDR